MGSFNSIGQREISTKSIPVWLGVVSPVPVGGTYPFEVGKGGLYIPAGTAVCLKDKKIYPFQAYEVVSVTSASNAIKVKKSIGILPKVGECLTPVGATFATTGAAGKITAIVDNGDSLDITFSSTALNGVSVGSFLALSAASAAATSGASLANIPNGYLYNDIKVDSVLDGEVAINLSASGAVVMHHAEGILIQRTASAPFASQMAVAVPNVTQVNG